MKNYFLCFPSFFFNFDVWLYVWILCQSAIFPYVLSLHFFCKYFFPICFSIFFFAYVANICLLFAFSYNIEYISFRVLWCFCSVWKIWSLFCCYCFVKERLYNNLWHILWMVTKNIQKKREKRIAYYWIANSYALAYFPVVA